MAEEDATAAGRKRKIKHRYNDGFFATHPSDLARAVYLREEAAKVGDEGDPGEAAYRAGIAKWERGACFDTGAEAPYSA